MSPATERTLRALQDRTPIYDQVAVVVAHPDDETVGIGPMLGLFRRLLLIHVTDGAPRNLHDANAAGFASCEAYAAARREELRAALQVASCHPVKCIPLLCSDTDSARLADDDDQEPLLPVADQSASLRLPELARAMRTLLRNSTPVLTHAYEGGHPDHDAVAFAVHQAGVPVIEITGYHAAPNGGIEVGEFLGEGNAVTIPLTAEERSRREAMLDCFVTQRTTLQPFHHWTRLRFRTAPVYDFRRPPHRRSYYDSFDWGITSDVWVERATRALQC
jgi:LmbE family N-acetylglucosaminyl deacetylase